MEDEEGGLQNETLAHKYQLEQQEVEQNEQLPAPRTVCGRTSTARSAHAALKKRRNEMEERNWTLKRLQLVKEREE